VGFCGGHPENLSSQKGVSGADQYRPETGETAQWSADILVLNKSTGITLYEANSVSFLAGMRVPRKTHPIAESETVMSRSTTQVDNETEDDETDNRDDLDGGEPELAFTEGAGAQKVDDDDDDASDGNPYGVVGLGIPVCKRP